MAKRTKKINLDGQTEEVSPKLKKFRSIDEMLGRTQKVYNFNNEQEYEKSLKNMPITDLERHATEVGILPRSNKNILIGKLVQEFRRKHTGYFNTLQNTEIQPKNKDAVLKAINGN